MLCRFSNKREIKIEKGVDILVTLRYNIEAVQMLL